MNSKKRSGALPFPLILSILFVGFLFALLLSLLLGGVALTPREVLEGLLGIGESTVTAIVRGVRLPRVLAGVLAGIGLSVSGCLLQSVTDNALASPNVIGVNSGAGLAVILLLAFLPDALPLLPLAAFAGAFLTTLLILFVSRRFGDSGVTVILSGVALTALLNAAISFVTLLDTDVVSSYNYFSIGGLSGVSLDELLLPAALILISLIGAMLLSRGLELLRLGDEVAAALGARVPRLRTLALICASASAAAAVSFAGLLGFVGLIVPHTARALVGARVKRTLPTAALLGGTLLPLSDLLGRTLFSPTEIPVGILMALVGAPFFFILLLRRKKRA